MNVLLQSNTPFPLKKELYKLRWVCTNIHAREFISESRQVKRANNKMGKCSVSEDQALRKLCDYVADILILAHCQFLFY